ncbi:MAG: multiubiquitin domain-containing protein [Chitinophagales bacterium]|nr:multiubiquitin domain-containing protein [Chitinophagales bacterium]
MDNLKNREGYVDVEALAKAGKPIPKGRKYLLRIDGKKYKWDKECITGREILLLAGKTPVERFQVNQRFRFGRVEEVQLDEKVDLATCGVERFMTLPLDQTEGRPQQRAFALPEEDEAFLNASNFKWEALREGNQQWLIIREFPIPEGYSHMHADVAIMITPGYPTSKLDMVYFHPELRRSDGKGIKALRNQSIEGKTYQRWSRHYTNTNPWRPGIDDISTHLSLVKHWLTREFIK